MTILEKAKKGIITEEMKKVAEFEDVDPEFIRKGVAEGSIVIPKNKLRNIENIKGIGKGLRTKINVNIGSSPFHMNTKEEIEKAKLSMEYGADSIMDLSIGSKMNEIRKKVVEISTIPVGTVPIYQTAFELSAKGKSITDMTIKDFLKTVENQAKEGVDFMTIHAGINLNTLRALDRSNRVLDVVSRGGSLIITWMRKNKKESPLYAYFDEILNILAEYDVTISLGDGMRPGAVADATDKAQIMELVTLGEMASRAREKGVQVIIEGPGHIPINMIEENIKLQKILTKNAPFFVLGPLVTDIAAGYDHIAGAIGSALAAYYGADFLCCVTPAEHLRLPAPEHLIEGIIAFKIAAHAADLAEGKKHAFEIDNKMSKARKNLDWETQIKMSINPKRAKELRESSKIGEKEICTMCGEFCAIKTIKNARV